VHWFKKAEANAVSPPFLHLNPEAEMRAALKRAFQTRDAEIDLARLAIPPRRSSLLLSL